MLFWMLVVAACVPLFVAGSQRWLAFDDWTLLITRRRVLETQGFLDFLLRPHNEHWLPGLMFWDLGLASMFGIDSYLPWTMTVVAALVLTAWILRNLMVAIGMTPLSAALAAPAVMIWSDFGGSLTWVPETVFVLYLALVLAHLTVVVTHRDTTVRREVAGASLSLLAVLFHTGAVAAVLPVVGVLALQRRWRAATLSAVPLGVYGLWLLTWGQKAEVFADLLRRESSFTPAGDLSRPQFAWLIGGQGFRFIAGPVAPFVWAALVIGGLVMAWRRRSGQVGVVLLALVAMSVIAVGAITQSRSELGSLASDSPQSRYAVLATLPLLPVAGLLLQTAVLRVVHRSRAPRAVAAGAVAALACWVVAASVGAAAWRPEDKATVLSQSGRDTMAAIISTSATRETRPDLALIPVLFDLDVSGVWDLHGWGWFDPEPVLDQERLLTVQARFLVYGGNRLPDDLPARLAPGAAVVVTARDECWTLSPRNTTSGNRTTIDTSDGPVVLEVVDGASNIRVQARRGDDRSPWHPLLADPETPDVRVHPDPGVQIVLEFTGPATLCGVTLDGG